MTDAILEQLGRDYRGTIRRGQFNQQDKAWQAITDRVAELCTAAEVRGWNHGYERARAEVLA